MKRDEEIWTAHVRTEEACKAYQQAENERRANPESEEHFIRARVAYSTMRRAIDAETRLRISRIRAIL